MALAGLSPTLRGADPVPANAPVPPASPQVEEWLNQTVRLHETVQAMNHPSPDGKPLGEIRVGAEIKAIGLVADKHWVKIELPDHSSAYLPRDAIEYENSPGSSSGPANSTSSASPGATAASAAGPGLRVGLAASADVIRGKVTRVPNSATLVVGDQRIRLSGIDPGPIEVVGPFENWVRNQGDLACEPEAQTGRYHCFTSSGVDVAEAAILNGSGRVGDGATPEYRDSETQARNAKRGLWEQP